MAGGNSISCRDYDRKTTKKQAEDFLGRRAFSGISRINSRGIVSLDWKEE
jgi:hypothetical protein